MPPDKVQHIIRQGGGDVDAPGPQSVSDTLQEKKPKTAMRSKSRGRMWAAGRRDIFGSLVIKFSVNRDGWWKAERMSRGLARWSAGENLKDQEENASLYKILSGGGNATFHMDNNETVRVQQPA